jgi:hypothetical protein
MGTDAPVFACRCRGGGLKGVTGFMIAKKPLRRFLRFTRGTDSLQRPCRSTPTASPGEDR